LVRRFSGSQIPRRVQKEIELFKARGKTHTEFEMMHKDGGTLVIEFEGLIGYDDHHRFQRTYCTLNDITERREGRRSNQGKANMTCYWLKASPKSARGN
jgi:PAS domain-containing protein